MRSVVQVSPGDTGSARVNVPVVTISPAASGGFDRVAREQIDEMAQRRYRSVQHVRRAAVIGDHAVALQIDFVPLVTDRYQSRISAPFQCSTPSKRRTWS